MIRIAIGMETKTRPNGVSYYEQTLHNAERAGIFRSPHLAAFKTCIGDRCTRQQNGKHAIDIAAYYAQETGAKWVMKLEDDLDFTDYFLESVVDWLEDHDEPRHRMFSLGITLETVSASRFHDGETSILEPGTSFPRVREMIAQGKRAVPAHINGFWGAQAVVWRAHDANDLARWLGDDPTYFDGTTHHRHRGHDLKLQEWVRYVGGHHFLAAVPSFVQHIGVQSNLDQPQLNHKQPFFQFPFAGRAHRYAGEVTHV